MEYSAAESRKGLWYAVGCYLIWGAFPIYWAPLNHSAMPAEQILAQRIVWSAIFSLILLFAFRQSKPFFLAFKQAKVLKVFILSSFLISINWLVYLWAVVNHHVLDASLGYFMNPLFNIFLGWLIFKEKMNQLQFLAIGLAAIGVVWLAVLTGQFPWVAILLAGSFGSYAVVRKLAPMDALSGLTLETVLLLPLALGYLLSCYFSGSLVFEQLNKLQTGVLLGSGAATTLPLLMFAAGVKRIPMSHLGILQYIAPTIQMLSGLLVFGEQLNFIRLMGYVWVWIGVVLFLYAMWRRHNPNQV